jgi:3-deoxy-D-arabino-heptulosonate 7-phosphate (DAHP) synthase
MIQIGARNMQNFSLCDARKVASAVLLKRGLSATLDEWLLR